MASAHVTITPRLNIRNPKVQDLHERTRLTGEDGVSCQKKTGLGHIVQTCLHHDCLFNLCGLPLKGAASGWFVTLELSAFTGAVPGPDLPGRPSMEFLSAFVENRSCTWDPPNG